MATRVPTARSSTIWPATVPDIPQVSRACDPVCGMTVDPAATPHHAHHHGADYFFCNAGCLTKFIAAPAKYIAPAPSTSAVLSSATWTCPMHPEILRDAAGSCPICGMALEATMPGATPAPNPERADMTRRWWIGAALALPLVVLDMSGHWSGISSHLSVWFQLALATPIVWWAGWPFFQRGWASFVSRNLNMFSLIALGVGAAYGYSLVATVAPQLFPPN